MSCAYYVFVSMCAGVVLACVIAAGLADRFLSLVFREYEDSWYEYSDKDQP